MSCNLNCKCVGYEFCTEGWGNSVKKTQQQVLQRREAYDEEYQRRWNQNQANPETRLEYDKWSGDWL